MRSLLLSLFLVVVVGSGSARAELDVGADDRSAIREVIEAQLAAFRSDDGVKAFSFATPQIQAMFKDPATFMAMVKGGYMPVYRPREVEFRELVELRGQPTQLVLLVGPDNDVVTAHYFMEKQQNGEWLIDGCMLGPARSERAI